MSKIHGQATIRINGQVYETEDDATLVVGGKKPNGRMIGQKHYHTETYFASKVTGKVPVTDEVSLRELQELTDATVIFESDNGRTYIIRGAVQVAELELTGGESGGTVQLEFSGEPAEEMI